ncbi:MAG: hypothetical protein GYA57_13045 [Myxococcales bacterium]|nr:hypothetical protein [Myxococcales bacterium]
MRVGWFLSCLVFPAGCGLLGDPGELVGEMTVRATLEENSCGAALGTIPDVSELDVRLYERSGLLTWVGSQGTFQASIDAEGNFVFQARARQLLRGEEPDGLGGVRAACVVESTEEIRGKLVRRVRPAAADGGAGDAGEAEEAVPASVAATDTLRVGAAAGADCRDFIGFGGTSFETLPCRLVVQLEGAED